MNRLAAISACATLALSCAVAADPYSRVWADAVALGGGSSRWTSPPPVEVLFDGPQQVGPLECRYGRYVLGLSVGPDGRLAVAEHITLYLDDLSQRDRRLLHEFLHAVWTRRAVSSPRFRRRHPDSEQWVRSLTH